MSFNELKSLTDEMILEVLNNRSNDILIVSIILTILFIPAIIFFLISFFKNKKLKDLFVPIILIILLIFFWSTFISMNNDKNNWYVTMDYVVDKRIHHSADNSDYGSSSINYHIFVENHSGVKATSEENYNELEIGDIVYIVVNKEGSIIATHFWKVADYIYEGNKVLE